VSAEYKIFVPKTKALLCKIFSHFDTPSSLTKHFLQSIIYYTPAPPSFIKFGIVLIFFINMDDPSTGVAILNLWGKVIFNCSFAEEFFISTGKTSNRD